MELSQANIERITRLIAERVGPSVSAEEIKTVANEVIERLKGIKEESLSLHSSRKARKLIVNAFGMDREGLEDIIKSYTSDKALQLAAISTVNIASFKSVIAILNYPDDIENLNSIKLDLDRICHASGFKAIIQDSEYYSHP